MTEMTRCHTVASWLANIVCTLLRDCSETKHNASQNNRQNDEATSEKIEFGSDNTTAKIMEPNSVENVPSTR